jgi:D-3-phosphoglycerate dehydrogenase / 2-oxoglutarate reductase
MPRSNRPKILRTDVEVRLSDDDMAHLSGRADVVTPETWDEDSLVAAAADAEIIVHSFFPTISAPVIEASENLKAIVKYGVGVDNIDIDAATRKGVMVINCPEYGSETVADHAFALLISLARKIIQIDRATRETGWVWPSVEFIGTDLTGKTLGLVGCGNIGSAMARRAGGFAMERLYYDPFVAQESVVDLGVRAVDFETLLEASDFISIHCILTPETRGLFDEAAFKRMKDSAYLVDVSRGAIIDETALVRALTENWIAGAGLDVFPVEPLTADYPLFKLDNVILTSHLAWYTTEADKRLADECMDRLGEVLDGKRPRNVKNAEALGLA